MYRAPVTETSALFFGPFELAGDAGIVRYHVLNDKRHVVTMDTDGEVAVWDVLEVCY